MSDADLASAVLGGDRNALAALYERFHRPFLNFAYWRLARRTEDVHEAVQETFLWALRNLARWNPSRADLEDWLFGILRNQIRTIYRRRSREESFEEKWQRVDRALSDALERLSTESLPDESLQRAETRTLVQMSVAQLPVRFQDAIRSRYWEGKSLEDIARQSGTTVKAAESLLARARDSFHTVLRTFVQEDFCVR